MVITVDLYKTIRQMTQAGLSQRQIASQLHISRNTVKKYCNGDAVPWERKPYTRVKTVVTEETIEFIKACLEEDNTEGIKKQKHTAKRIYERLTEECSFKGGESTIRGIVRELRQKHAEVFLTWLKKQNLKPKQLCYLLHQCLEHGCTAVMNGELPTQRVASVADPVHIEAVDLSAYDYLCSSKRCSV